MRPALRHFLAHSEAGRARHDRDQPQATAGWRRRVGRHGGPAGRGGGADRDPAADQGPFYPLSLPLDADNDLVIVEGRPERAAGTILHLGGRVLDPDGRPVRGARVEIWQCDAFGVYHHPRDRRGPADANFQGFGATTADDQGAWRFRTIEPVPYPGRTPHIHFKIAGPGFEPLTTQMYLAGHPLNERDGLYRRLGEQAQPGDGRPASRRRIWSPPSRAAPSAACSTSCSGPGGMPRDG